jgi:ABC-2 type transport system permease protein
MLLIAGVSKTEGAANGLGRGIMVVLAMVGGGSIPVSFMPPLLRKLGGFSPFTWVVNAIEGALWRDYSLSEMALPFAVLSAIAIGGLVSES